MTIFDGDDLGVDEDDDEPGRFAEWVATYGEIGARLRSPRERLDLAGFAQGLRRATVVHRLAGWARLAADPGLAGRIRGTLGTVLAETASPEARDGHPCRWSPPSTFEALFRKQGRMTPGTDFPSPWVVTIDPRRGDLEVGLSVFGMAVDWLPAAAEAMTASLPRVDWAGTTGRFVGPLRIADRRLDSAPPPQASANRPADHVALEVLSPLVSSGAGALHDPAAAFTTLRLRLEGLARWHEATLAVDGAAIAADLRAAHWTWSSVEEIAWTRGSSRQGGRTIPMAGVVGRLEIDAEPDRLARLMPLLTLGAATHVGADIAFGCGRYVLV